jgi:predicted dehydrogenase
VRTPETVAIVAGPGTPGPELTWAFEELPQAEVRWLCDPRPRNARHGGDGGRRRTRRLADVLADEDVDAVAFASTELAAKGAALSALAAEKHVLVVGPLAETATEAEALVAAAAASRRALVAAPPSLCRAGVMGLRRLVDRGALGEVFYAHVVSAARRHGPRGDVLGDLGPEAVALVLDIVADEPVEVVARAESYLGTGGADVLRAELRFATGVAAYIDLSALAGEARERVAVAGSEAAAVLTLSPRDRSLVLHPRETALEEQASLVLELGEDEELRHLCAHFLAVVRGPAPRAAGRDGCAVVAVVEALGVSALAGGAAEPVAARAKPANVVALVRG